MYLLVLINILLHAQQFIIINAKCVEQGPDFLCWFDKTQFLCHCVHTIHACKDIFNPNVTIIIHFSQIVPRVCTLVLFISTVDVHNVLQRNW